MAAWAACAHPRPGWALTALAALGLLLAARAAARLALWLYAAFLRPARPLRRRGATDGISRALAFHLAAARLRLVLVGHSLGGLSVALAMERFPGKVAAAVFLAASMPRIGSHMGITIQEVIAKIILGNSVLC